MLQMDHMVYLSECMCVVFLRLHRDAELVGLVYQQLLRVSLLLLKLGHFLQLGGLDVHQEDYYLVLKKRLAFLVLVLILEALVLA